MRETIRIAALVVALLALLTNGAAAAESECTDRCPGDLDRDGLVAINELVLAVNHALGGCPEDPLVLLPAESDGTAIVLRWEPMERADFSAYRVYRAGPGQGYEVIGVLNDWTIGSFRDTGIAFGATYSYYVAVVTRAGREIASNVQQGSAGVFIEINGQVEALQVDGRRPYLYALDRVNNSLYFINTQSRQLEKTIFVGSIPTDMDIDAMGSELFIANFGATEIAVVDLETQEKVRSLFVDTGAGWGGNPYRLACGPAGHLVYTSEDQWNDLTLINSMTGATLSKAGSVYQPALVASPDKTRIYVGESGISSSAPQRYDIAGDTLTPVDAGSDAGGYSSRTIAVSGDGRFVFYAGGKYLANNLKAKQGTFSEPIHASNSDGSLVFGSSHIFNGNTFSIARPMPVSTETMAIAPDDSTLYLYQATSSRIYFVPLDDL